MQPMRPVALVTGATRGIGRELALTLASTGYDLVVTGRSTAERPDKRLPGTLGEVVAAASDRGARAASVAADLANPSGVVLVVDAIEREFGRCDVLVNNAAISYLGPFLAVDLGKWRKAIDLDLMAPIGLMHALVPGMLARAHGTVVNISSLAAVDDPVPCLPYGASKAALERISVGLARQLEGTGVSVTCVRIDEGVATEAMAISRPDRDLSDMVSAAAMAAALTWIIHHAADHSGVIVTMADLRELGALP
jgi:citronellol/citronellal dehydrogenase